MAYNNGFPFTYQPYYPQSYQAPTQTASGGIIWVQGEAGAKSYLVAPNSTVQLWDSERQTIYLKSADASGMPSMKVLDYTIREAATPPPAEKQTDYATKDEVNGILAQIRALRADVDKMKEDDHE